MNFGKKQVSPKERKTSPPPRSKSNRLIFEVGNEEEVISVGFETGWGSKLFLGSTTPKPMVVGHGAGRGSHSPADTGGSLQRPLPDGSTGGPRGGGPGPVGLRYLASPSMSMQVSSPGRIFQKPLSAPASASVGIEKPYFFLSHKCVICSRKFEPGDDIFMLQDDYAFCTLECRAVQIDFFEKRNSMSRRRKKERQRAAAKSTTTYSSRGQSSTSNVL